MWNYVQFPKGLAFWKSFIFTSFIHSCIQQKIFIENWLIFQGLLGLGNTSGEEDRWMLTASIQLGKEDQQISNHELISIN